MMDSWVFCDDVAKHPGVAKDFVYRWMECRNLRVREVGRLWNIGLSEVDERVRVGSADEPDREQDDGAESR